MNKNLFLIFSLSFIYFALPASQDYDDVPLTDQAKKAAIDLVQSMNDKYMAIKAGYCLIEETIELKRSYLSTMDTFIFTLIIRRTLYNERRNITKNITTSGKFNFKELQEIWDANRE